MRHGTATSPGGCDALTLSFGIDSLVLLQADSTRLTPVLRCGSTAVAGATFEFSTADSDVATVTSGGLVTARSGGRTWSASTSQAANQSGCAGIRAPGRPGREVGHALGHAIRCCSVSYRNGFHRRVDAPYLGHYLLPDLAPLVEPSSLTARDVEFSPVGDLAFVANYEQKQVTIVDVVSNTMVGSVSVSGRPLRLLPHPGGQFLFVTTDIDSVFKIDIPTRAITARLGLWTNISGSGPTGLVYTDQGSELLVSSTTGMITVINVGYSGNHRYHDRAAVGVYGYCSVTER